jgi:hypothetical protein
MNTRKLLSFNVVLVCLLGSLAACTLRLEDNTAPSFEAFLEADYDIVRWGADEKSGWAAPPPKRKGGHIDSSGTAFRIRGQFSHSVTWYDAEGTHTREAFSFLDHDFPKEEVPVKADGWRYRGRLAAMPGFAFWGGKFFIAALVGLEGVYLGMDLVSAEDPTKSEWTEFGIVGVPIGCHVEGTLGHVATPFFTYAYAPTIATSGLASGGHFSNTKLGVRLWPGSFFSGSGIPLWIEGGWQWSNTEGGVYSFDYEILLSGPYGAIGWRF